MLDLVGTRVDRYDVLSQLGRGGFGVVYRARHAVVGNEVALKVLWPDHADDPRKVERFVREARAAASLGHPSIVRVLDAGAAEGVTFLAMELLDGADLDDWIERRGALPVAEAAGIADELLSALEAAHARGIVHRDLKPANVFVTGGRAPRVRILDFGISKIRGEASLTDTGMILGTPAFMAPEQIEGRVDARSDLFAVGAILFTMLAGRAPFDGGGFELLSRRMSGEREPPLRDVAPEVPAALAAVVRQAMAPDPDARFADATSMRQALAGRAPASAVTLPAAASRAPTSLPPPSVAAPPRRSRIVWGGLAGLALLLAAGVGVLAVLGATLWRRHAAAPAETSSPPTPLAQPTPVPTPAPAPAPAVVPQEVPVAPPEPAPEASPPTVERSGAPGDPAGVRYTYVSYLSAAPRSAMRAVLERARPAVAGCHRGRQDTVSVEIIATTGGEITIAMPHTTRHSSDAGVAACVAGAIRGEGPLAIGPDQTAIAELDVVVPAPL
ncbi:MAG: serine/threonine-protein kinase [Myxococcota bacterium]|nr:serine/threonine-protein kinase [Myxococcota bacterium]